jgi:hypothetical protein
MFSLSLVDLAIVGVSLVVIRLLWLLIKRVINRDGKVPLASASVSPARRRWFQFGMIGALALVILSISWLNREIEFRKARNRQMGLVNARGGYALSSSHNLPGAPLVCRILQDASREIIELPQERFTEDEAEVIRHFYPEAKVTRVPQESVRHNGNESEF